MPTTFLPLYLQPEATRLIGLLRQTGLTDAHDWSDMDKVAQQPLRVRDVFSTMQMAAARGIALGSRFPELTKKLLAATINPEDWNDARLHGLDIPASPSRSQSIPEREQAALMLILPFVEKARPDLVAVLGLITLKSQ